MTIERLPPGVIVELSDPVLGGKKLGLVDESGVGYFELIGEDEVPKPIHSEFAPKSLGPIESWVGKVPAAQREIFVSAWRALTAKNLDLLTLARALRWGLENESVDVELMERMGHDATARILDGRQTIGRAYAPR